ncbi:hypothetical protein [Cellvibrio japonicus]|uniref:hypothetical protein n=1 Tax=Cellvibrio japonicus TaxID=155077 RepID=UPI0011D03721|nr:hypothetical protein [Cellvibrio japonicus]QEI11606.1 hypothetical protein FY117_04760 [Cellvibrio japonicus]QEI15180.1 hypothetical protein FY116_04760 [Cellvibrio japonicus]QEI18760.1 hypothetical protein FY115_04760 [Cellvibrio japonicus]
MQYSLTIIVIVLVFSYVIYRAVNYYRKTSRYFINVNDDVIRSFCIDNNCHFPFDEFKSLWVTVSKNLGCPDGKMIENCKIRLLMENYPFPEIFVDDIFMDFEKYSQFSWNKEMLFGEFIASLYESKNNNNVP